MRQRRIIRTGIAAIGVLALVVVGPVSATPTEAAWSEPELVKAEPITAAKLTPPTVTASSCVATPGLLGLGLDRVDLTWRSPDLGYQKIEFQVGADIGSEIVSTPISGPVGGLYTYTARYTQSKLLGLLDLTNLLGGSYQIRISSTYPNSSWESPYAQFELTVYLLGLIRTSCTLSP